MDDADIFWASVLVGAVVGLFFGTVLMKSEWEADVIRRGLAIHCPADGKWAWNGECDK